MDVPSQIFNTIFGFFKGFLGINDPGITEQILKKVFINQYILLCGPPSKFFDKFSPECFAQRFSRIKVFTLTFGMSLFTLNSQATGRNNAMQVRM